MTKRGKLLGRILLLMVCTCLLSGCARMNVSIDVKKNGKADVSMLYAMADMSEYGVSAEDTLSSMDMQEMEKDGWECSPYTEGGFIGYQCVKRDVSLKDLSTTMSSAETDADIDTSKITMTKSGLTYTFDWKVFDEEQAKNVEDAKKLLAMGNGYMDFVIRLPFKPKNHNATSVSEDGKTLKWDLLSLGPDQTIHVEFMVINLYLIIGILVVLILVIAGLILFRSLRNKRNTYTPVTPSMSMGSAGEPMGGFGEAAPQEPEGTYCPHCGVKIAAGAMFCRSCGKSVIPDSPVAPPPMSGYTAPTAGSYTGAPVPPPPTSGYTAPTAGSYTGAPVPPPPTSGYTAPTAGSYTGAPVPPSPASGYTAPTAGSYTGTAAAPTGGYTAPGSDTTGSSNLL